MIFCAGKKCETEHVPAGLFSPPTRHPNNLILNTVSTLQEQSSWFGRTGAQLLNPASGCAEQLLCFHLRQALDWLQKPVDDRRAFLDISLAPIVIGSVLVWNVNCISIPPLPYQRCGWIDERKRHYLLKACKMKCCSR